jgi:Ca2+-binding EF-hand superfamily protein
MKQGFAAAMALAAFLPVAAMATGNGESFSDWDQNGDGTISAAEVQSILSTSFLFFDTNHDGYIDDYDFTGDGDDGDDEGDIALEFGDTDGDDRVSLAEFTSRTDDWIAVMDRNGDGEVKLDDFGGDGF